MQDIFFGLCIPKIQVWVLITCSDMMSAKFKQRASFPEYLSVSNIWDMLVNAISVLMSIALLFGVLKMAFLPMVDIQFSLLAAISWTIASKVVDAPDSLSDKDRSATWNCSLDILMEPSWSRALLDSIVGTSMRFKTVSLRACSTWVILDRGRWIRSSFL